MRCAYSNQKYLGEWKGGWMDGWVAGKAGLRIAYSNQKVNKKIKKVNKKIKNINLH